MPMYSDLRGYFLAPATLVQDGGAKNSLRPNRQTFIRYRQKVVDVTE